MSKRAGRGTISEVGVRRELGAGFLLDEVLNEGLLDSEDGVVFQQVTELDFDYST
jgi:translation initiation factor IF-2